MNPLIASVFRNDIASVTKLVKKGNVDIRDNDKRTPLLHAVIDNRLQIAQILITAGANINAQDKLGCTPLHYAAQNYYKEMVGFLIMSNASIDAPDNFGNTPLGNAVFYSQGRGEIIALLLKAGADRNKKNYHGQSPLSLAEMIANYDVLKFFN